MNAIYKEARRCFARGEFSELVVQVDSESGYATVFSKDGQPLQTFVSAAAAQAERRKQVDKAGDRWIGKVAA